jgi:hypothetical protein
MQSTSCVVLASNHLALLISVLTNVRISEITSGVWLLCVRIPRVVFGCLAAVDGGERALISTFVGLRHLPSVGSDQYL